MPLVGTVGTVPRWSPGTHAKFHAGGRGRKIHIWRPSLTVLMLLLVVVDGFGKQVSCEGDRGPSERERGRELLSEQLIFYRHRSDDRGRCSRCAQQQPSQQQQ